MKKKTIYLGDKLWYTKNMEEFNFERYYDVLTIRPTSYTCRIYDSHIKNKIFYHTIRIEDINDYMTHEELKQKHPEYFL